MEKDIIVKEDKVVISVTVDKLTYDIAMEWNSNVDEMLGGREYLKLEERERPDFFNTSKVAWKEFLMKHKDYFKPKMKTIKVWALSSKALCPDKKVIDRFREVCHLIDKHCFGKEIK